MLFLITPWRLTTWWCKWHIQTYWRLFFLLWQEMTLSHQFAGWVRRGTWHVIFCTTPWRFLKFVIFRKKERQARNQPHVKMWPSIPSLCINIFWTERAFKVFRIFWYFILSSKPTKVIATLRNIKRWSEARWTSSSYSCCCWHLGPIMELFHPTLLKRYQCEVIAKRHLSSCRIWRKR